MSVPQVTTNLATNIGEDVATFQGNLDSLGLEYSVDAYFKWGTTSGIYTDATSSGTLSSTGPFSTTVSGLDSGTEYHYCAVVTNGVTTWSGVDVQFVSINSPSVTTGSPTDITYGSVNFKGHLDTLDNLTSADVYFEYGTTTSYGNATTPETLSLVGWFSQSVDTLESNQTYHYRTVITDGVTTWYGSDVQFTSEEGPEVTTNEASGITYTSAVLNGDLDTLGSISNANVYFEYELTASGYINSTSPENLSSPGSFSSTIYGLTPGQEYDYRAVVTNGSLPRYGSDTQFTSINSPEVITGTAINVGGMVATVQGYLDYLGLESSVSVYFEYGTSTSYGSTTTPETLSSIGSFSFDISGLSTGQVYHYRAVVTDGVTAWPGSDAQLETKSSVTVNFSEVVGSETMNDWTNYTVSGVIDTDIDSSASYYGEGLEVIVETTVSGFSDYPVSPNFNGTVSGTLLGTVTSGSVYSVISGLVSGTLIGSDEDMTCYVENYITTTISGNSFGTISGSIYETFNEPIQAPMELMYHQYSTTTPIDSSSTEPKPRRHHGENSIIFSVTFGEAYNCRLTAWDDDTHSTTNNKILDEEHYKVDAVAYRSNVADSAYQPVFTNEHCLVYPPVYDKVLKGTESYYGDFDLIFSIVAGEYGEYLAFAPRLVNMDNSFSAGSYDFVTTLHYEYT
jgi:hypothetical protein